MARINIEDDLFKDRRFSNLVIKLGSRTMALGALVEAWVLAQQFVEVDNPAGLIPKKKWFDQEISPEILECRMAKETEDGRIEVAGAVEQFSWLVKAKVSGKKGGDAKATHSNPEATPEEPSRAPKPPTLTPTLTPSLFPDPAQSLPQKTHVEQPLPLPCQLWNQYVPELPPVKKPNATRNKLCASAIQTWGEDGLTEIFKSVALSDFLHGRTDSGTWRASFDWAMKPGNLVKIHEGNYSNREGPKNRRLTNAELNEQVAKELWQKFDQEEKEMKDVTGTAQDSDPGV